MAYTQYEACKADMNPYFDDIGLTATIAAAIRQKLPQIMFFIFFLIYLARLRSFAVPI
jgi:hypothetical protein